MITILGSTGFIGSALCEYFRLNNIEYAAPARNYNYNDRNDLGDVIYAIGLTADFRKKPFETIDAHVCQLAEFLKRTRYKSFLYLSSTRVYSNLKGPVNEQTSLTVNPSDPSDLYNISKLMGEAACLAIPKENIRIARLSNVIGNDFNSENFITSLLKEIRQTGKLHLNTTLASAKDYIGINDVVQLLYKISLKGSNRIYNVASGSNITNQEIISFFKKRIDFTLQPSPGAIHIDFPQIDNRRITEEFFFNPGNIFDSLSNTFNNYLNI